LRTLKNCKVAISIATSHTKCCHNFSSSITFKVSPFRVQTFVRFSLYPTTSLSLSMTVQYMCSRKYV
jgi:hypothetical protein